MRKFRLLTLSQSEAIQRSVPQECKGRTYPRVFTASSLHCRLICGWCLQLGGRHATMRARIGVDCSTVLKIFNEGFARRLSSLAETSPPLAKRNNARRRLVKGKSVKIGAA